MTAIGQNLAIPIQSYAYREHYLKIEDSKGMTLFIKTYDTQENLKDEYEKLKHSKKPYLFTFRTTFPVRCDSITHFFQTLFIPNTLSILPSLKSRVEKVAVTIFTVLFDLMTLPLRLTTSIPYIIYSKYFNKEEDHKIIALICNNSDAAYALDDGKVVIRNITEDFSHIQPYLLNGVPGYQVQGNVSGACSDVYIKHTLYGDIKESTESSTNFDGNMNSNIKSRYRAFQAEVNVPKGI